MEIKFNKLEEPKFFFKDLKFGDTFIDEENFGKDTVLMCIRKNDIDYDINFDEPHYGAAIQLRSGEIYGYGSHEPVIPVSCSLTVNR